MTWERARSKENKDYRVLEIVEATGNLFDRYSFEDMNFVAISKEAGFTRSNMYKYFNSKEEIFLEILKSDIKSFVKDLENEFEDGAAFSVAESVDKFIGLRLKYTRIRRIYSMLNSLLGNNCSEKRKDEFLEFINSTNAVKCKILSRAIKGLDNRKAYEFLIMEASVAAGLFHIMNFRNEGISPEIDIEDFYRNAALILLEGLIS